MARKEKVAEETLEQTEQETVEQTEQEAVEVQLTAEEQAIQLALSADDKNAALANLANSEVSSAILKTIINTFLALSKALGIDAPATQHALSNLQNFKSVTVKAAKAAKAAKAPKEPKFNEVAELKKVLASETPDYQSLLSNDKVSDMLKVAITTYTTLAGLEDVDQSVVEAAKSVLVNFGSKGRARSSAPTEEFNVESEGTTYKNLAAALRAHGHDNEVVEFGDGKRARRIDIAWRAVRSKLLAGAIGIAVEYSGHTYTKVAPSANAIGGTRGRQKKEESASEASSELVGENSYE